MPTIVSNYEDALRRIFVNIFTEMKGNISRMFAVQTNFSTILFQHKQGLALRQSVIFV